LSFGQRRPNSLRLSGTVLGYTYDDSKGLFNRNKTREVEGSVPSVWMKILNKDGDRIDKTTTSGGGDFSLNLELGQRYTLIYGKADYGTSAFQVDLNNVKPDLSKVGLVLKNIELILNSFKTDKPQDNGEVFVVISFDNKKEEFIFKPAVFDKKNKLFKDDADNTPFNLMFNSLGKNKSINKVENIETKSDAQRAYIDVAEIDTTSANTNLNSPIAYKLNEG